MAFKTPTEIGIGRPASTLTDVLRQVSEALSLMADATPVMIGARYLEQNGVGSPPRVLFVPEPAGPGKIGPPLEMGNAASMTHSCNVFVRAPESGDDLGRFDALYALTDLVVDLVGTAATGRVVWGAWVGDSPSDVDGPGADGSFSFTYQRDIQHAPARWSLPAAALGTAAPNPVPPPGEAATEPTTFTVTVTPES